MPNPSLRTSDHDVVVPPSLWPALVAALAVFRDLDPFAPITMHLLSDAGTAWFGGVRDLVGWFARLGEAPEHRGPARLNDPWLAFLLARPVTFSSASLSELRALATFHERPNHRALRLRGPGLGDLGVLVEAHVLRALVEAGERLGALAEVRLHVAHAPSLSGPGDMQLLLLDGGGWRAFTYVTTLPMVPVDRDVDLEPRVPARVAS